MFFKYITTYNIKTPLLFFIIMSLSGCSLLEIKLESGVTPLPQEQLSMRVFSRDFSHDFYSEVEGAADQISRLAGGDTPPLSNDAFTLKSNTLMWKINSEQALQRTLFQSSPVAAMIDTWVFTSQMNAYLTTGEGSTIFSEHQPIAVAASERLADNFEATVKGFLSIYNFKKYKAFVNEYVENNPITDITFTRQSAFKAWLEHEGMNEAEAITTFGTMPEVMSDVSDRVAMIAEQMPKTLTWKAELYALHANISAEDLQDALQKMSDTSIRFQTLMEQSPEMVSRLAADLMEQSPEMMAALAANLREELSPMLTQLSEATDNKLVQLSIERQAIELMIKNERLALEEMVARERIAAAQNLQEISQHAVEVVFQEITNTLKSLLIYFILFVGVIFFAPLCLGVWLGKRMALKQKIQP